MHFVKAKGILSNSNGMNIYRGCSHGCIYCDSRSRCYFNKTCSENGILSTLDECFGYLHEFPEKYTQMSFLADLVKGD